MFHAKRIAIYAALVALSASLASCGGAGAGDNQMQQQGMQMGQQQNGYGTQMQQRNQGMYQNQGRQQARNQRDNRVQVADQAAEQIAKIPGVRQANVLVTENNAYVAAVIGEYEGGGQAGVGPNMGNRQNGRGGMKGTAPNGRAGMAPEANHEPISPKMKKQIAEKVRAVDPNIQNVYVSTNPDFVDRVNSYADDIRQGRPVEGLWEEFSEMVQRIFPTAE